MSRIRMSHHLLVEKQLICLYECIAIVLYALILCLAENFSLKAEGRAKSL